MRWLGRRSRRSCPASAPTAILRRAVGAHLMHHTLTLDEQGLGEALAQRTTILDTPDAPLPASRPGQPVRPALRRIRAGACAKGTSLRIQRHQDMLCLVCVAPHIHPPSHLPQSVISHSGTTPMARLSGVPRVATLPFGLSASCGWWRGRPLHDKRHIRAPTLLESAPSSFTLTDRPPVGRRTPHRLSTIQPNTHGGVTGP